MKKLITLALAIAMLTGVCSFSFPVNAGETKLPHEVIAGYESNATILLSASDFTAVGQSGLIKRVDQNTDYVKAQAVDVLATDNMVFDKAVSLSCHTLPPNWLQSTIWLNFDMSSTAFKAMKSGDTLLLKYTARTTSGEGKYSIRFFNASNQSSNLIYHTSADAVPSTWTTYYYPLTIADETYIPNQIILRTSAALQSIEFGDFEIISYGTSVSATQIATALANAGATAKTINNVTFYTCEPQYKTYPGDGNEGDDNVDNTEKQMITKASFISDAISYGDGVSVKGTISATDSENFGLGFTDTIKASCLKAGAISGFNISCNVTENAIATKKDDVVLLTFYAKAKEKVTNVKASILSTTGAVLTNTTGTGNGIDYTEHTYSIPTQWTKICFPVTVSGEVGSIRFDLGSAVSEVEIGGVTLEVYDEGTDSFELPNGYFLCEPYTRLVLDYDTENYIDRNVISGCTNLEIHGDYIYAIGKGSFFIVSAKTQKVVGRVTGLGETRQLAISEDGNTAVITSRVDGAFVIACDNKENPELVGRCDTVEYATGVAVANNYCYISNRVFGTEIIDISDRTLPKHISNIKTGEAQSCEIVGTTLFAGCWGGRLIEAWDVSDPANPILLNKKIPLSGKGDGLSVMGNYLYAATGHGSSAKSDVGVYNVGYGLGNGMDIFDISDIKNPVLLSSVRIDDHFYTIGEDYWDVEVAKDGNKVYAYVMNTFNGVYIYDVTNPAAPVRKAAIELTVTKDKYESKYTSLLNSYGHNKGSRRSYYPYDTYARHNSPVGGVAVANGKIYLGGTTTGMALVDSDDVGNILFEQNTEHGTSVPGKPSRNFYELDYSILEDAGLKDIIFGQPGGQVYSVDEKDGLIYAACGNQGIKILDTSLNTIKEFPTSGNRIVSEAIVHGNRLYTAEGMGGIAIYEISNDGLGLNEISRYISAYVPGHPTIYSVKFIRLSPDGRYVLCDSGSSHSELVDFTDLENPTRWNGEGAYNNGWNPHSGLMYFRQLSTSLVGGRYLCSYGYSNQTYWYDFGENPETDSPKLIYRVAKCNLNVNGGFAALGGKNDGYAIGIKDDNTFFVFKPSEGSDTTDYSKLPHYTYSGTYSGTVSGKPSVFGDIMLLCDRISGRCDIIDISGLDIPAGKFDAKHITTFTFTGNPDIAKVIDSRIVFPIGNQGIASVSLDEFSKNSGVTLNFATSRSENAKPSSGKYGKATLRDSSGNTVAAFYENANTPVSPAFTAYIPDGTYTLNFEKAGYLAVSQEVIVNGEMALPEITLVPGDIPSSEAEMCGDGVIDIDDFIRILRGLSPTGDSYLKMMVDLDEDGTVSVFDLALLKANLEK